MFGGPKLSLDKVLDSKSKFVDISEQNMVRPLTNIRSIHTSHQTRNNKELKSIKFLDD